VQVCKLGRDLSELLVPDQASKGEANRFISIYLRRLLLPGHPYNRRSPGRRTACMFGGPKNDKEPADGDSPDR
jgi:hypothetical protein